MLKVQEIRELIKLIDQSSLDELTYESEGSKVKLRKNSGVSSSQVIQQEAPVKAVPDVQEAQVQAAPALEQVKEKETTPEKQEVEQKTTADINDDNLHKVESPMVGTFYAAPSPDEEAFVKVGDQVTENSVVCIVEAMKLFNEIEAEVKGEVVEVLVEDGQLVEYGQPLFLVKP